MYGRLLMMTGLSFVAMYLLMYAMVDRWDNVLPNLNKLYMAGLMAAPMVLIELGLMGAMYPNRRANRWIMAGAAAVLVVLFALIRMQAGIGDHQFLKAMIPHHSSAILMCGRAPISDPEIRHLCKSIIESQQREIDQMKDILARQAR